MTPDIVWKVIKENDITSILLYAKKKNIKEVKESVVKPVVFKANKVNHVKTHKQLEKLLSDNKILIYGFKSAVENGQIVFYGEGLSIWINPNPHVIVKRNSKYRKVEDIINE
jgi:hypothetical protein